MDACIYAPCFLMMVIVSDIRCGAESFNKILFRAQKTQHPLSANDKLTNLRNLNFIFPQTVHNSSHVLNVG